MTDVLPVYWKWLSTIKPKFRRQTLERLQLPLIGAEQAPTEPVMDALPDVHFLFATPYYRMDVMGAILAFKLMGRSLEELKRFQAEHVGLLRTEKDFEDWMNAYFDWNMPVATVRKFFELWSVKVPGAEGGYYRQIVQDPYYVYQRVASTEIPSGESMVPLFWKARKALVSQLEQAVSEARAAASAKNLAGVLFTLYKITKGEATSDEVLSVLKELEGIGDIVVDEILEHYEDSEPEGSEG